MRVDTYFRISIYGSTFQVETGLGWVADERLLQQFASQQLPFRKKTGSGKIHIFAFQFLDPYVR